MCLNPAHNSALERFTNDIILILVSCTKHCIKHLFHRLDRVPWSSEFSKLKHSSVHTHHNWVVNGKPCAEDIWLQKS